jgi:hypothetical protein
MTQTTQTTPDVSGLASFIDVLEAEPLGERFPSGPTVDTWLATLWGIRPGHSSPRGGLSCHNAPRPGRCWLYSL